MKISQTGPGAVDTPAVIRDSRGKGLLPMQVAVAGEASYRIMGRVSPDGRWQPVRAEDAADFLESISWVPYLRLEVLSGSGTVTLCIGEE